MKRAGYILIALLANYEVFTQVLFNEVSDESGVYHVSEHSQFTGGGVAFFDFDGDLDDDIYLTGGAGVDKLFLNEGNGFFKDISLQAGLYVTNSYNTTGVAIGDIDNDGNKDIFLTTESETYGEYAKDLLLWNDGNGNLLDIWSFIEEDDRSFAVSPCMIDFDLDGDLDIYVPTYVEDVGFEFDGVGEVIGFAHTCFNSRFYINNGDKSFTRSDETLGEIESGCSLASMATDFDMDGDPDIIVANDFGEFLVPNQIFRNNYPEPSFTEVSSEVDFDIGIYGMGIANGDIDEDGDFDYYVTNFGRNILMKNNLGSFSEVATEYNCENHWIIQDSLLNIGWGAIFFDPDNDADLDLFVTNGYVPSSGFIPTRVGQKDALFEFKNGAFENVSEETGIDNNFVSRGVAHADFDNDGDQDVFVMVLNVPMGAGDWYSHIFKNDSKNSNNWSQVLLQGTNINHDALGSKIWLYANGKRYLKEHFGAGSHCSQSSSRIHFGLEEATIIDSLVVDWTGGFNQERYYDLPVNKLLSIVEQSSIDIIDLDSIGDNIMPIDTMEIDTMEIDTMFTDLLSEIPFSDLNIHPNPTNDYLHISNVENVVPCQVEIVNIKGEKVMYISTYLGEPINIKELSDGIYYLNLIHKHSRVTIPFAVLK